MIILDGVYVFEKIKFVIENIVYFMFCNVDIE